MDPDYSYTDEEMAAIEAHKKHYKAFIDELREERKEKVRVKEYKQFNDDTNIGIKVRVEYNVFNIFDSSSCYTHTQSKFHTTKIGSCLFPALKLLKIKSLEEFLRNLENS